jgi:integrase
VADEYLKRHVRQEGRREAGRKLMEWFIAALRRAEVPAANQTTIRLDQKPIAQITTADVRAVRDGWKRRRGAGKGGRVGVDRGLKRLRHLFNWAIEHGFADHTPFQRHGVVVVHFVKDSGRTRRLEPGEERELLEHASPWLRTLITAALETGMRKGELLQLRWRDVKWDSDVLLLPADITKTCEARDVPMTQPLRALLELHRHAPDGTEHPLEAFVFGNEVGERISDIRDDWAKTCKAAGITGLNFHDLRREFASRLRETPGVSDHHVRDWLGHADMATTSKYLSTTRTGLQQARRQFERHRESFAHDLHKRRQQPVAEAPISGTQTTAKLLN